MLGTVSRKVTLHTKLIDSKDQEKLTELLKYFWEKKFDGDPVPEGEEFNPDWTKDIDIKIMKKMGKEEEDVITVEYKDRSIEIVNFAQLDLFVDQEEVDVKLSQSEIADRRLKTASILEKAKN